METYTYCINLKVLECLCCLVLTHFWLIYNWAQYRVQHLVRRSSLCSPSLLVHIFQSIWIFPWISPFDNLVFRNQMPYSIQYNTALITYRSWILTLLVHIFQIIGIFPMIFPLYFRNTFDIRVYLQTLAASSKSRQISN